MTERMGNFHFQNILDDEVTFRTSTARISFFPTKIYILKFKESDDYFACLNTNVGTPTFKTINELIQHIQSNGFGGDDFGASFDGRTPSEYDYHIKVGSKVLEYSDIIHEIELQNPLTAIKSNLPEFFI